MLTLALDTATGVCTVGLVQDRHVLAEYDISVGLTHSEGLMPQMDQMFSRTGIKKEEIDRIRRYRDRDRIGSEHRRFSETAGAGAVQSDLCPSGCP